MFDQAQLDCDGPQVIVEAGGLCLPVDLRARVLIAFIVYSFARISAALGMKVEDVFTQHRRLWVRLRE